MQANIEKVESDITKVKEKMADIEAIVEDKSEKALLIEDRAYLRSEKALLRSKEAQLRSKEEQLRIQMNAQLKNPTGGVSLTIPVFNFDASSWQPGNTVDCSVLSDVLRRLEASRRPCTCARRC